MSKSLYNEGDGGAGGESEAGHEAAGQCGLRTRNMEMRGNARQQEPEGVAQPHLDEGDGEGGEEDSPAETAALLRLPWLARDHQAAVELLGVGTSGNKREQIESFKKEIMDDMNRLATANKFTSLERCKDIHVSSEQFSIENDLITPTFKLKRNVAKKRYQAVFDQMYGDLSKI